MKKVRIDGRPIAVLAAAVLVAALASCAGQRSRPPTLDEVRKIPYKQASVYSADADATLAKPVAERIGAAPAALLGFLREADGNPAYAPRALSEPERALFAECYASLPARFRSVMELKLLGVYFIDGFAGGGMSDFIFRDSGAEKGSLLVTLVLNPKTLELSLPDWIAYRDSSPYEAEAGFELRVSCAGGDGYKGLIHTLTHEAAHIYDYFEHATPFVEPSLARDPASPDSKDFTRGIWEGYATPKAAYAIPKSSGFSFYGLGKKQSLTVAAEQYEALAKTPFASMYGAGSWAEDFAECAAWTWLREKLGVEYSVSVLREGREALVFRPGAAKTTMAREDCIRDVLD